MPWIIAGSLIRATPPSRRMSAGTRSSAITAAAPASSAIFACSGVTTSMITPPFSISARPALTVNVDSSRGLPLCSLIWVECRGSVGCAAVTETGIFVASNGSISATELARGPWDPGAQHGGAPAALLMRAFEQLPAAEGLAISRVTYEFLRPVPLGELEVSAEVVRPGRRVQLLEASVSVPGGLEVVRARALQVHRADPRAP